MGAISIVLTAFIAAAPLAAQLGPPPVPAENPITPEKAVLGKLLFWEEQLSSDNTVACGTCHIPAVGGADPRPGAHPGADGLFGGADDVVGSPGVIRSDALQAYAPDPTFGLQPQVTGRAAPSAFGLTQWASELFWDGRALDQFVEPQFGAVSVSTGGALESQAVAPIVSPVEMGHQGRTWSDVVAKLQGVDPMRLATNLPPDMTAALAGSPSYPDLFQTAFGTPAINAERIALAIATYERTLVPDQTPYDLGTMTMQQQAGHNFLRDHTVCFNCHVPPQFTDHQFYNIGLRPAGEDIGRQAVTGAPNDLGSFRTPTLRNVGLKSALMHVGWITDVQDSIDFYNAPAFPQVDPVTGHTQFTADQSGIPTAIPGFFATYQDINMPAQFHPNVVDFLENGLTDPRVAGGLPPFDRPTLHSEALPANPQLFGTGSAGAGGVRPLMIAVTPPNLNNFDFKMGVGDALGGAAAWLALSTGQAAPGTTFGSIPVHVDAGQLFFFAPLPLAGLGVGQGYATAKVPIGNAPGLIGLDVFGQWFVVDAAATDGLAASAGARWTIL